MTIVTLIGADIWKGVEGICICKCSFEVEDADRSLSNYRFEELLFNC